MTNTNNSATDPTTKPKLKIFISYSRANSAFANELAEGLDYDGGFETYIDKRDIHEGEDWKTRLGNLIAESDTIIFLLSVKSATSPICVWEVEEAVRHSKRILPLQIEELGDTLVPPQLSSLNYIIVETDQSGRPQSFMRMLTDLRRVLNTDVEWLREHTRLLSRAEEWNTAGRTANRMLLGADIAQAKNWIENKPKDAPSPTDLHHDYIKASEQAEVQRTSAERERADKLESALHEAEQARAQEALAARKLLRRTIMGVIGSIALAAVGLAGGAAYKEWQDQQLFEQEVAREGINGEIVAYATARGELAYDSYNDGSGSTGQSPYTTSVIEELRANPTSSFIDALTQASQKVVDRSGGLQRPFLSTSMNGKTFLWHQPDHRRRLAVVVWLDYAGNEMVPELASPGNDAAAFVKLLQDVGYRDDEIIVLANPDRNELLATLTRIEELRTGHVAQEQIMLAGISIKNPDKNSIPANEPVQDNSLVTFYYSGHGYGMQGQEYIIPNFDLQNYDDVFAEGISVSQIIDILSVEFSSSIFIFDTNFSDVEPSGDR
ncbi:MAG: TIR domain-containing protein [Pikeienuella sp.]